MITALIRQLIYRSVLLRFKNLIDLLFSNNFFLVFLRKNFLEILLSKKLLPMLTSFLKNHCLSQFKVLTDLTALDKVSATFRFQLQYYFSSYLFNTRLRLVTFLGTNAWAYTMFNVFTSSD